MKIAGKEYDLPVLNFGTMQALEADGLTTRDMNKRPLTFLAGFVGLAVGGGVKGGNKAIDEHLESGGSVDELAEALNEAIEKSSFFKQTEKAGRKKKETA